MQAIHKLFFFFFLIQKYNNHFCEVYWILLVCIQALHIVDIFTRSILRRVNLQYLRDVLIPQRTIISAVLTSENLEMGKQCHPYCIAFNLNLSD